MDFRVVSVNKSDECLPIKHIEDLKIWKPDDIKRHTTYPLQKRAPVINSPKTLVCHDMKGGYLGDRFLNGSEDVDNYYFIHWSMIDIFIYFSHHLVSVPPCNWIASAHRNGVKILGTFITEWDAGAEICNDILSDIPSVHHVCMQLVNIANFFQFDGWLINIENKLTQKQVCLLEEFVRFLTLKMHEIQPESLVIWYDSVIESGELKWQNELNKHNKNFFDVSDGIFLNYNWTVDTLQKSVEEAGSRKADVFVGVDVFGRGCLGGGGFSTDIAVTAARDYNLSVAIFAPGWVFETLDIKNFKESQYRFWDSLSELCAPRVIEGLPYYTSFCPGFGKKMYRQGKIESFKPWFNLGLQQPQPSFHYKNCLYEGSLITFYCEDSFNGGGCLHMISDVSEQCKSIEFGILSTNFHLNSTSSITYTFKPLCNDIKVVLVLNIQTEKQSYVLNFVEQSDEENEKQPFTCICCEVPETKNISPISSKIIKGSENDKSWIRRKYKLYCHKNESCFVKKVSVCITWKETLSKVSALLGELLISPTPEEIIFSYKDLNVRDDNENNIIVECILEWKLQICIDFFDIYLVINGSKNYICTTSQYNYKFVGQMCKVPVIEFILSPKCSGKSLQPVLLKIPLES